MTTSSLVGLVLAGGVGCTTMAGIVLADADELELDSGIRVGSVKPSKFAAEDELLELVAGSKGGLGDEDELVIVLFVISLLTNRGSALI